jgi:hypothetical protein
MENCENRNDPDLVQAFLKKWWVESDFKAPNQTFTEIESLQGPTTQYGRLNDYLFILK